MPQTVREVVEGVRHRLATDSLMMFFCQVPMMRAFGRVVGDIGINRIASYLTASDEDKQTDRRTKTQGGDNSASYNPFRSVHDGRPPLGLESVANHATSRHSNGSR
jgi:hypothetical protein